jgi:hypothetical protein
MMGRREKGEGEREVDMRTDESMRGEKIESLTFSLPLLHDHLRTRINTSYPQEPREAVGPT